MSLEEQNRSLWVDAIRLYVYSQLRVTTDQNATHQITSLFIVIIYYGLIPDILFVRNLNDLQTTFCFWIGSFLNCVFLTWVCAGMPQLIIDIISIFSYHVNRVVFYRLGTTAE